MSKENSLRHFLKILFSEGDRELDGSEEPESLVGPAALVLLMGVEARVGVRNPNRVNAYNCNITDITDASRLFYVLTQTIISV